MAKLLTLLEQYLDTQPPIVVIQAIIWWEAVIAFVKLPVCGLGVHLPVKVAMILSVLFCSLNLDTVVSRKYAPPFGTLASVQNVGGACARDATISLAITPPPSGTGKA